MTKAEQARALHRAKPWLTPETIAETIGSTAQNVRYALGPREVDGRSLHEGRVGQAGRARQKFIPLPELGL